MVRWWKIGIKRKNTFKKHINSPSFIKLKELPKIKFLNWSVVILIAFQFQNWNALNITLRYGLDLLMRASVSYHRFLHKVIELLPSAQTPERLSGQLDRTVVALVFAEQAVSCERLIQAEIAVYHTLKKITAIRKYRETFYFLGSVWLKIQSMLFAPFS